MPNLLDGSACPATSKNGTLTGTDTNPPAIRTPEYVGLRTKLCSQVYNHVLQKEVVVSERSTVREADGSEAVIDVSVLISQFVAVGTTGSLVLRAPDINYPSPPVSF